MILIDDPLKVENKESRKNLEAYFQDSFPGRNSSHRTVSVRVNDEDIHSLAVVQKGWTVSMKDTLRSTLVKTPELKVIGMEDPRR